MSKISLDDLFHRLIPESYKAWWFSFCLPHRKDIGCPTLQSHAVWMCPIPNAWMEPQIMRMKEPLRTEMLGELESTGASIRHVLQNDVPVIMGSTRTAVKEMAGHFFGHPMSWHVMYLDVAGRYIAFKRHIDGI
jgi:hypothetical protein